MRLFSLLALTLLPVLASAGEVTCTGEEQEAIVSWQDFHTTVAVKGPNGGEHEFKNCDTDKSGNSMAIECKKGKKNSVSMTAQLKGGLIQATTLSFRIDGSYYPSRTDEDFGHRYYQLTCK